MPFVADDPHADEPVVELDGGLWKRYTQASVNAAGWKTEADRLRAEIEDRLGDAYAGIVDGAKVVLNRPTARYAITRLLKDYPALAQHFMVTQRQEVFDLERFSAQHPEIAERYRVRSFRPAATE